MATLSSEADYFQTCRGFIPRLYWNEARARFHWLEGLKGAYERVQDRIRELVFRKIHSRRKCDEIRV